jgi:putative chitinase
MTANNALIFEPVRRWLDEEGYSPARVAALNGALARFLAAPFGPDRNKIVFDTIHDWLDVRGFTAERIAQLDAALADYALAGAPSGPGLAGAAATAPPGPLPGLGVGPIDPDIATVDAGLLALVSDQPRAELEKWVAPIRAACIKFEINTVRRVAAFIAQMAHESGLKPRSEDLNYRAQRLVEVWHGRFPTLAAAQPYAHNPEKLANKVYAGRMGNGDEASGDGWRFRGGGPLQNTGRANWEGFAASMGMTLDEALAYGRTLEGGIMAAAWFWETNDINRLADTPGVADETRRINGGENGLADRTAKFDRVVAEMLRRAA